MTTKEKIINYCNFQERCHQEVRDKLYEYGLHKNEVESMIADLISENLLNEERFARSFVRTRYKGNKWGKIKIVYALQSKRVSEPVIKKALAEIDDAEYLSILKDLYERKYASIKGEHSIKKPKTVNHLQGKGFSIPEIMQVAKSV